MLRQEKGKTRYDVKPRKRDRRADAQTPRQGRARPARGEFGFVGFVYGPFGAFVEMPSRLGRRQPVGRTQQESHAESLFELRDRFGDGWLADTQLFGCTRERAGIDHRIKASIAAKRSMGHSLEE